MVKSKRMQYLSSVLVVAASQQNIKRIITSFHGKGAWRKHIFLHPSNLQTTFGRTGPSDSNKSVEQPVAPITRHRTGRPITAASTIVAPRPALLTNHCPMMAVPQPSRLLQHPPPVAPVSPVVRPENRIFPVYNSIILAGFHKTNCFEIGSRYDNNRTSHNRASNCSL